MCEAVDMEEVFRRLEHFQEEYTKLKELNQSNEKALMKMLEIVTATVSTLDLKSVSKIKFR